MVCGWQNTNVFDKFLPNTLVILVIFENTLFSKITLNTVLYPRHNCSIDIINDRRVDLIPGGKRKFRFEKVFTLF